MKQLIHEIKSMWHKFTIRWVSENLKVNEEFVGLYEVSAIDAETLAAVAKDTFTRLNLLYGGKL